MHKELRAAPKNRMKNMRSTKNRLNQFYNLEPYKRPTEERDEKSREVDEPPKSEEKSREIEEPPNECAQIAMESSSQKPESLTHRPKVNKRTCQSKKASLSSVSTKKKPMRNTQK